ncbi:MAG: hypothetical protein [Caudoviricetes sp.]|nr:MAG: hypothetical protein [Caudoviricetes sp.]
MKLIYILGAADGKVEEWTPPLSASWLPPETRRVPMGITDPVLGELKQLYVVVHFDHKEAYYIPQMMSAGAAIVKLASMRSEHD